MTKATALGKWSETIFRSERADGSAEMWGLGWRQAGSQGLPMASTLPPQPPPLRAANSLLAHWENPGITQVARTVAPTWGVGGRGGGRLHHGKDGDLLRNINLDTHKLGRWEPCMECWDCFPMCT